jgi:uncharacterized repeat protein (TIGR01451 family)
MGLRSGRTWLAAAAAVLGLALAPAGASAVTTIGSDLTRTPTYANTCSGNSSDTCTWSNITIPMRPAQAPSSGVIVRWRVRGATDNAGFASATLRVIHKTSNGPPALYQRTSDSSVGALPVGAVATSTFAVNPGMPIGAGDQVGLEGQFAHWTIFAVHTGGNSIRWFPALGTTPTPSTFSNPDSEMTVNADVEPDADRDGYGDETQDQCPNDPSLHASGCSADLSVEKGADNSPVNFGDNVSYRIFVRNAGSSPANATITDTLPVGTTFVYSNAPGGCTGTTTVTCSMGEVPVGSSRFATIIATAKQLGPLVNTAQVTSPTFDPNSSNNSATASVDVVDLFKGLSIDDQSLVVKKTVPVAATCPTTTPGACTGTLDLTTTYKKHKKRVTIDLGSQTFSILKGASGTVKVTLTKRGRKLLAAKRKLKATASAETTDAASAKRKTKGSVTLRIKKTKKKKKKH